MSCLSYKDPHMYQVYMHPTLTHSKVCTSCDHRNGLPLVNSEGFDLIPGPPELAFPMYTFAPPSVRLNVCLRVAKQGEHQKSSWTAELPLPQPPCPCALLFWMFERVSSLQDKESVLVFVRQLLCFTAGGSLWQYWVSVAPSMDIDLAVRG